MPYAQPYVLPPSTVLRDPSPLVIPTSEASASGQQGWLTDQLRGKRVWCRISINYLYICEEKDLNVARQIILLPGCSVRQLELKPADHHIKVSNGIARRFMSKSASRLGEFHFVLENPVSGQQLLFGVETQCEFDQWQAVLGKICPLPADSGVTNGQQIGDFSQWKTQLKRACSEPQISTDVAQDGLLDRCSPFAKGQVVKGNIFPVQSDNQQTESVQTDHNKTELVQSIDVKTDLVQSEDEKTCVLKCDNEEKQFVQSDHEQTDLVQSDDVKTGLVQSDDEKTDFVQSGYEKTDFVQSVHEELDLVQSGLEKANTPDRVRRHDNSDNSHITPLPIRAKYDINYNSNTEATWPNNQRKTREARSVVRFKPSLGTVFRRLTRSASTGSKRQLHSLSNSQQDGNIAYTSGATDADSSDLQLEVPKKQFFTTGQSPLEASLDKFSDSESHSFSIPRLAAKIFGDSTFYRDAFSKSAGTTLKDLKEVLLSEHLLCRTGSKLRRVYCVLSHGCLYMFGSTRPDVLSERVIALHECAVTYVSKMHERSSNLFAFKLCQSGRDGICLTADNQQTLLRWMAVIQSVSVRVQSAEDIVSELLENKQVINMRSTPGACLQGGKNGDVPGTGKDIPEQGIVENANMTDLIENYDLSVMHGLTTSNTYPTESIAQQSVSPAISRKLVITSRPNAVPGLSNSRNAPLDCDQQESSRLSDMSRCVTHRDTTEKWVGNVLSNNSTCDDNQIPSERERAFNSSTYQVTSLQAASTRASKELKETNTQIVEMIRPDDVCSSPLQDVSSTQWAKPTIPPRCDHHQVHPSVAPTHLTNHHTGFESRDEINQSLLDESKADAMQPNQKLVHNYAMKQTGAATRPCLLQDVKKTVQQRHQGGTIQTGLSPAGHDVYIVEDDWNLADTRGVMLPLLSQPKPDAEWKGLSAVCATADRNTTDSDLPIMGSSQSTQGISQYGSAAPDTSDGIVRQTISDTVTQHQKPVSVEQEKSLASVKEQLLAEVARQKLQLKAMRAVRDGAKGQLEVSPGPSFLPPDVDKVCLLTKLLQRKMSTQIQLEAIHRQIEASRDRTKERSMFQIGKKRTDTLQGNTEMNSERSELEEQVKVLSMQLQELDQFLDAYSTSSPVPHPKARNSRLRHSYDQALLRNIRLNAEPRSNSNSSRGRSQEKLKDKVSQLYRSLSLKSSVQKLAQKTFSRTNWYRNKGSTHPIEEKASVIKPSSATTNSVSRVASVVTDMSSSGVSDTLDKSARAIPTNTLAHSENEFVSNSPLGRFQDEPTLEKKIVLTMSPSVAHLAGNIQVSSSLKRVDRCPKKIQMSRSLTHLDKCTVDREMSPSLTHLERYKDDLQMSPASTPLERRTHKIQKSASSSLFSKLSFKRENTLRKDLCGTSVSSSQMTEDLLDTAVTSRHRMSLLLETVGLSASPGAGYSAGQEDCQEIMTLPRSVSSTSQEYVISGPPRFSGQGKIVTEPDKRQVSASALAEIQAFETLLEKCLGPDPSNK